MRCVIVFRNLRYINAFLVLYQKVPDFCGNKRMKYWSQSGEAGNQGNMTSLEQTTKQVSPLNIEITAKTLHVESVPFNGYNQNNAYVNTNDEGEILGIDFTVNFVPKAA